MTDDARSGPVVVTGGAGAIGSVLVAELLARGREVRVVDNLSSGRRDHLPPVDGRRLSLHAADLRDPAQYEGAFAGATELWHLAANTDIRKGTDRPGLDFDDGIVATYRVLEAARRHGLRRAVYASSSVVYGFPTVFPTPESYGPLAPQSLYGAAKLSGEAWFSAYAHTYGLRVHLFRFANIIGPHMTHGVLVDFFAKLAADPTRLEVLGDGRQAKSYLRTEDCVAAMLTATDRTHDPVNVFNLGTRDRISVREIAEKVVAAHGGRARIEFTGGTQGWVGDVPQQLLAVDRIRALGWEPRWNSAEAIDRTIAEMIPSARATPQTGATPATDR
ncbi:MAG TPA: NAD-dependent epimerase/dehydratase family protein [Thermoplasmata archaeon]|nr:NAD-dependent epimerase/dehydratase family protein [Thermoplasmata archaeon]